MFKPKERKYLAEKGIVEGNKLVRELVNNGQVSKYRLAKDLGVSETAVYDWIKDAKSPNQKNYLRLKEYQVYLHGLSKLPKWNKVDNKNRN